MYVRYVDSKDCFYSTLGVYKGVIVTMNIMNIIIIIDGPMKTLINHTSRLLT
jgi:hypothetical protein